MKILVIGDLHGRKPVIKDKDFDAIIQVGDVCDDRELAPLTKGWFKYLKATDEKISLTQFFEMEIGGAEMDRRGELSLMRGRKILEYLNSFGKPVFMVPGNWDDSYGPSKIKDADKNQYNYLKAFYDWWLGDCINPKLIEGLKNIRDCQYRVHKFGGVNFVGYGLSSSPEKMEARSRKIEEFTVGQYGKLKKAYGKLGEKLRLAYFKGERKLPVIFITHNIPHNTKLDIVRDKGSYVDGKHLGSNVAREFCNKFQPMLCVGGHIHDSPGRDKIGKTVVVNPGYGARAQVLIEVDEKMGKIKSVKFVS